MSKHIGILILIWVELFSLQLYSQEPASEPRYRHYSINDGLPGNEVYHVMQDSRGYLWFSTDRGVSRYDGYEFINFTTDDGLVDNTVFFTHEDEKGRIWFVSYSSLLCYFKDNSIHQFKYNHAIEQLRLGKLPKVSFLIINEEIYVGMIKGGMLKVDYMGNTYLHNDGVGLHIDNIEGRHLIYAISPKLYSKEYSKNKRHNINVLGSIFNIKRHFALHPKLVEGDSATFFSDGTNVFKLEAGVPEVIYRSDFKVSGLQLEDNGNVWVTTIGKGALCIDPVNGEMIRGYSPTRMISWICEDREGGIWLTSTTDGVYYIPPGNSSKKIFEDVLPKDQVDDIDIMSDQKAFVSYSDGRVYTINPLTGEILGIQQKFSSENIKRNLILIQPDQKSLVNIQDCYMNLLNNHLKTHEWLQKARKSKYEIKEFQLPLFTALVHDGVGGFLLGTNQGMFHFKDNVLIDMLYTVEIETSNGILIKPSFPIDDIYRHHDGRVLISSLDGLYEYADSTLTYHGQHHVLLKNRFDDIAIDSDGKILLGSRGKGLVVWDSDTIYSITRSEGLSNNLINSIAVDSNGIIWIGTNQGLNELEFQGRDTYTIKKYSDVHGLPSNQISKIVVSKEKIWVGTLNGLVILNRNEMEVNKTPPKMVINEVRVNENALKTKDHYELSYDQNAISLTFTGITFKNSNNVQYKYRLNGLEKEWITTKSREVRYNSLDHGNYKFELMAANEDGTWSDSIRTSFVIHPPIWLRWWFLTSIGVLFCGAFVYLLIKRDRKIREKAEIKRRFSELELKALRSQMNPHFTFNTLSSIQQFILQNDSIKANDYLSRFAFLIRKVLENSRHSKIKLSDEIETLKMYLELEKLRFIEKLNYEITIDPEIDPEDLEIPPSLIQPFIENSILHGISNLKDGGNVKVEFKSDGKRTRCIITDNGIGREEAQKIKSQISTGEKSLGVDITRQRIELMKETGSSKFHFETTDVVDQNGKISGTRVTLYF